VWRDNVARALPASIRINQNSPPLCQNGASSSGLRTGVALNLPSRRGSNGLTSH
jgi:hypothetical protein